MPLDADDLEEMARQPAAVSGDAGSVTSRSADDIRKLNAAAAAAGAIEGVNANGGPRSLWNRLRPAKATPKDPS